MRRLLAPIVALAVLAVFPATASAAINQYASGSCTYHWEQAQRPIPFVCLTESVQYGGDKLILTGSSDINNLGGPFDHEPTGYCSPKVAGFDDWNDCISAVWVKLGTNDSVCLYRDGNYHGVEWWAYAPATPSGATFSYSTADLGGFGANDAISAVMLQQSGTDCGEGGV